MPDDAPVHAPLARPKTVRARHAASLLVWRDAGGSIEVLMGMRGGRHRFMPNRLVFPGGAVDRADFSAPAASGLPSRTETALRRNANPELARALGIAAARELQEETGLSLGHPPALDGLDYLARAVTPPGGPIRFNARFFCVRDSNVTGTIGGDGELEDLRYYGIEDALSCDLAHPTRCMLEQLREFLAMSTAERDARTQLRVLKDRDWRLE